MPIRTCLHYQKGDAPPYARLSLSQCETLWFVHRAHAYSVLDAYPVIFALWLENVLKQCVQAGVTFSSLHLADWRQEAQALGLPKVRLLSRWYILDGLLESLSKQGQPDLLPLYSSREEAEAVIAGEQDQASQGQEGIGPIRRRIVEMIEAGRRWKEIALGLSISGSALNYHIEWLLLHGVIERSGERGKYRLKQAAEP